MKFEVYFRAKIPDMCEEVWVSFVAAKVELLQPLKEAENKWKSSHLSSRVAKEKSYVQEKKNEE